MVEPNSVANLANVLTLTRLFATPVFIVMITDRGPDWVTFFLGAAISLTDAVDGWIARRHGTTTSGAFLDPLVDKVFVLGGMYAFVSIGQFHWLPVTIIAVREIAMSLYRMTAGRHGVSVPASFAAKVKVTVQIWALGFALLPPVAENAHWIATTTLWVAVVLTVWTGYEYFRDAKRIAAAEHDGSAAE